MGGTAHRLSISADGSLLAVSVLLANHIFLYSLPDGKKLIDLTKFEHQVEALAFSPIDNSLAAGAKDHRVYLWKNLDSEILRSLKDDQTLKPEYIKGGFVVTALTWSLQADHLAISGTFKQAHTNNPKDGQVQFYMNGAADQLTSSAFSPDGSLIAVSGSDGIIRIYENFHPRKNPKRIGWSFWDGQLSAVLSCGKPIDLLW